MKTVAARPEFLFAETMKRGRWTNSTFAHLGLGFTTGNPRVSEPLPVPVPVSTHTREPLGFKSAG